MTQNEVNILKRKSNQLKDIAYDSLQNRNLDIDVFHMLSWLSSYRKLWEEIDEIDSRIRDFYKK